MYFCNIICFELCIPRGFPLEQVEKEDPVGKQLYACLPEKLALNGRSSSHCLVVFLITMVLLYVLLL